MSVGDISMFEFILPRICKLIRDFKCFELLGINNIVVSDEDIKGKLKKIYNFQFNNAQYKEYEKLSGKIINKLDVCFLGEIIQVFKKTLYFEFLMLKYSMKGYMAF
jgi:hypothetical protein